MDMLQLRLFLSVSQTRNFTKTANEFYMTQPTVSNYIKALESSVGVKLLNRDSRNVSMTPEGQEFIGYASRMLTIQLEAENRLRNMSRGRSGYIRIAMLSSTAELFSQCLEEFSKEQQGVQVDVDKLEGVEMMRAVGLREYDVYFANLYIMPESDGVAYRQTGTEQLRLFVHRSIADTIDMGDWTTLEKYRFVSVPEINFALSGQIKSICAARGIAPDIINYYNRADTLLLAVNAGIGMAILPPGLTYSYSFPNVVPMPIEGQDALISSVVAWHPDKMNPDIRSFLELSALSRFR